MFITIEGLDGAGTTTLSNNLMNRLDLSRAKVRTQEPTHEEYGSVLRKSLSDDRAPPLADFYGFLADRAEHIDKVIEPALDKGNIVVCDRYADSTRAYQPIALSGDGELFDSQLEAKMFIEQAMSPWVLEPDVTLYLQVDVGTAMERAEGDEKYENRQYLEAVKDNYDALADSHDRIKTIDATKSETQVHRDALEILDDA